VRPTAKDMLGLPNVLIARQHGCRSEYPPEAECVTLARSRSHLGGGRKPLMPKYRVTVLEPESRIVEAESPYMAAIAVGGHVVEVKAARGPGSGNSDAPAKKARVISPAGREKMRQAAAKARAAKARKATKKRRATR
jgi:hypothetical protein